MDAQRVVGTVLLIILSGCASTSPEPASPLLPDPVPTLADCRIALSTCFEPVAAWLSDGTLLVSSASRGLARSTDGGRSFEELGSPPLPEQLAAGTWIQADAFIQSDALDSLYYSAILARVLPGSAGRASSNLAVVLEGIQVARSDDMGASWATNIVVRPVEALTPTLGADRQWLALGTPGTLHLVFHRIGPIQVLGPGGDLPTQVAFRPAQEILAATSTDGGATFSPFAAAFGLGAGDGFVGGRPVVGRQGSLLVPALGYPIGGGSYIAVAEGRDGAFERHYVHRADNVSAGVGFPILASDAPRSAFALAWHRSGQIVVACSSDGTSWSEPHAWDMGGPALAMAPWIEPVAGARFLVAGFVDAGGVQLEVKAGACQGPADGGVACWAVPVRDDGAPLTDFPHLAVAKTTVAAPWASPDLVMTGLADSSSTHFGCPDGPDVSNQSP